MPPSARTGRFLFAVLLLALVAGAGALRAQTQERGLLERIKHPDRTLKYEPADHNFGAHVAGVNDKTASVRPFLFSRAANLKSGDGAFRTRDFNSSKGFRTEDFSTKPAVTKDDEAAKSKSYAVRALPVNEERDANKTRDTHGYMHAEKPYLGRGKRQDTMDEIYDAKKMSIDQVRELLNKPKI